MGEDVYPPLAEVRGHLRVKWYRSPVEPATLRRLMQRSDLQGWLQAGGHLALAVATGALVWWCWARGLWMGFALALFAHGTVASFFTGVAPHELAHGTVFRTRRLNQVFLYLYSLLSWWDPFDYGTSHTYHHRYTLYPEGDRENLLPLHPSVGRTFLLQMFTLNLLTRPGRNFTKGGLLSALAITVLGAFGLIGSTRAPIRQWIQALHLDQPAEAWKSMWWSRAQLLFHGAVAVVGIASGLWVLPLVISAAPPAAPLRRPNMFMYEDMHWHEEIETWMWLPQARRAIKVDDYTVRLETDVPYPVLTLKMAEPAGGDWHSYYPKHYLQKWHIRYNEDANALAKEEGFDTWVDAFRHHFWWNPRQDMNFPTMQPWVLTQSNTTNKVHDRNPYYWKVDSEGQQLPYVDRIVTDIVDWETYHLKIISGESDVAFVNTAFENFSLYKQNEDAGGYNVVLLPGNKGADVGFRVNQNHPDPVKGGIYRDVRFRQAISLAIDRDDLNNALFFGLAMPRQFTILPNASYYKPEWGEAYADFDPDRANELLDAVGLSERDNQGFRVGADGKTFELVVEYGVGGEAADPTASLELVKEYWENVGIKVLLKSWEAGYFWERMRDPEHEIAFHAEQRKEVRSFMVERASWTAAGAWAPLWHLWLIADANVKEGLKTLADYDGELPGEEPPQYVKQLFEYGEARIRTKLGSPEYRELSQKIYDWHAEHLVHIGAVGMAPHVYIANKKLGNVPREFYTGIGGSIGLNIPGEQLFFRQ